MKPAVIKEMTKAEIIEKLEIEKTQLVKLKMNHAVSPLENPLKIKDYKKNVARLETELNKRKDDEKSNLKSC